MNNVEKTILGAGCFWGVQERFDSIEGVLETAVGYAGGHLENPTYEDVCSGTTNHAEVILIQFNPEVISFKKILEHFFNMHDPTQKNRQGPDIGSQYRSLIMYENSKQKEEASEVINKFISEKKFSQEIVTEIVPWQNFYMAEDYHQKYFAKKRVF